MKKRETKHKTRPMTSLEVSIIEHFNDWFNGTIPHFCSYIHYVIPKQYSHLIVKELDKMGYPYQQKSIEDDSKIEFAINVLPSED